MINPPTRQVSLSGQYFLAFSAMKPAMALHQHQHQHQVRRRRRRTKEEEECEATQTN